jgi:hypothetical protein
MGYLIVFLTAAGVGVGVYALTIREGIQPIPGFSEPDRPRQPEGTYVSVSGDRPDWQSRLTGLLGLSVAVVLGAVALAAVMYLSVSTIVRILGELAPDGVGG